MGPGTEPVSRAQLRGGGSQHPTCLPETEKESVRWEAVARALQGCVQQTGRAESTQRAWSGQGAEAGASQLVSQESTSPIHPLPRFLLAGSAGPGCPHSGPAGRLQAPGGRALPWVLRGAQASGPLFVILPAAPEAGLSASWTCQRPSSVLFPEQEVSCELLARSLRSRLHFGQDKRAGSVIT